MTAGGAAVRVGPADPDQLAAAVLACPDVLALSGGRAGEVASYLPGRRVTGIQVRPDAVSVHVVARYGPPVGQVAQQVRDAVAPLTGGLPINVGIDDLAAPEPAAPAASPAIPPLPA